MLKDLHSKICRTDINYKLKALKTACKEWCKSGQLSTSKIIQLLRDQLQQISDKLQADPFNKAIQLEEANLKKELSTLPAHEEDQYRQKS